MSAINEQSAKTGINASLNSDGTQIILTNATGNNIVIGDTVNANAGTTVTKLTGYDAAGPATVRDTDAGRRRQRAELHRHQVATSRWIRKSPSP